MEAFVHSVGVLVGCGLALAPALLPSARPTRRWPHVVMALGMAAGHLGGTFLAVAVLTLLAAIPAEHTFWLSILRSALRSGRTRMSRAQVQASAMTTATVASEPPPCWCPDKTCGCPVEAPAREGPLSAVSTKRRDMTTKSWM